MKWPARSRSTSSSTAEASAGRARPGGAGWDRDGAAPLPAGRRARIRSVGIPQALFYHLHPGLWEAFFEPLGIRTVLSGPSRPAVVERAGMVSEPEHCLPVKLFDAHLDRLAGQADAVLVPRILSTEKGWISCPKLAALPDAVRARRGDGVRVLSVTVDENRRPLAETLARLGRALGARAAAVRAARDGALAALARALAPPGPEPGPPPRGSAPRFLLLGHPYNLHDPSLCDPVLDTLRRLGARVRRAPFHRPLRGPNPLHWDTCARLLQALRETGRGECDGVIHLSSFQCGCDSIAGTMFREAAGSLGLPFLALVLDGHTARGGVETRLEAFLDSLGGAA